MTDKHCGNCIYCGEVLKDNLHSCNNDKSIFKACLETATGCEKFEPQTIPQLLEEVVSEMCNRYCKYPQEWDEEAEGCELSESDVCANCPLNRLV